MKKDKSKRFLSILLILCIMLTLMPNSVFAAEVYAWDELVDSSVTRVYKYDDSYAVCNGLLMYVSETSTTEAVQMSFTPGDNGGGVYDIILEVINPNYDSFDIDFLFNQLPTPSYEITKVSGEISLSSEGTYSYSSTPDDQGTTYYSDYKRYDYNLPLNGEINSVFTVTFPCSNGGSVERTINITIQHNPDFFKPTDPGFYNGDIYVYNGRYTIWNGGPDDFDASDETLEWHDVDSDDPIIGTGSPINKNIYVLDNTDIYFKNLDLGKGGLYSHGDFDTENDYSTNLEGGVLRAKEIKVNGSLYIDYGSDIYIKEDIEVGYNLYSYGSIINVGGNIIAPYVYFDSVEGPLYVTVGGNLKTYYFEHIGGAVHIAGNLDVGYFETDRYPTKEGWDDYDFIYINNYYAYNNFTELHVGGNIVSPDLYVGDFPENELQLQQENDSIRAEAILVTVGGDVVVDNLIYISSGVVNVDGAIKTTSSDFPQTICIYGGKVTAGSMDSATAILIGHFNDIYEKNDEISVTVLGNMTAAYEIDIEGGNIDVGGAIKTTSVEADQTIFIMGDNIRAGAISSATGLTIGHSDNVNKNLHIVVEGSITANEWIQINDCIVYANSISCVDNDFIIDEQATLFNAVNNGIVNPYNTLEKSLQLYRTTLSGLIPNAMAEITIYYGDYAKVFTAVADGNGEIFVWLVGNEELSGSAKYYENGDTIGYLNAPFNEPVVMVSLENDQPDIVDSLEFGLPGDSDFSLARIGIDVDNIVFGDFFPGDWVDSFNPINWVFTNPDGSISGFSGDLNDYEICFYRNGILYPELLDYISFVAGDYLMTVSTLQTINEIKYLAAGSVSFTVSPAILTVDADDKTATVGASIPDFSLSMSDNTNSDIFSEMLFGENVNSLFNPHCIGTTESPAYFSIFVLTDYYSVAYNEYARLLTDEFMPIKPVMTVLNDLPRFFLRDSIQIQRNNGDFTVRASTPPPSSISYTYYTIAAKADKGGNISPSGNVSVLAGADKEFIIKANDGYIISDVLVDGKSVGAVDTYNFKSVYKAHTITAQFVEAKPINPFTDVPTNRWFTDDVLWAYREGLMTGTGSTIFDPFGNTTRGMIATILHRLENTPSAIANVFTDVPSGQWYTEAVDWASSNNIVKGYGDGRYGPSDPLTREQIVTILYRYAQFKGYDVNKRADIKSFKDAEQVSDWARVAMEWAVEAGLIKGMGDGTLAPLSNITRAQMASILARFTEKFIN